MCGIAGIISKTEKPINRNELNKLSEAIAHRGPDGDGLYFNESGTIGLAHRRLSIIDLSADANQPMQVLDRYIIIFNGEIYNFIELREQLVKSGYSFRTKSDTEVLCVSYHHYGIEFLNQLDGMFAFCIYDIELNEILFARDRFGEKPFYIQEDTDCLRFASEIKSFWKAGIKPVINEQMVYYFLAFELVENPKCKSDTFFSNISKLEAAHYVRINMNSGERKQVKYWHTEQIKPDESITFDEACEQFRYLFSESVKRRLRADVPIGSSLSGGLDSSTVACAVEDLLKKQNISHEQYTFSARFEDKNLDEGDYIETIVKKIKSNHYDFYPHLTDFINQAEKITYHQDEPFGSASIFAQWDVFRMVNHTPVKVILDGQGADEYLAGYPVFFKMLLKEKIRRHPLKKMTGLSADYESKNSFYDEKYTERVELNKIYIQAYFEKLLQPISTLKYRTIGHAAPAFIKASFHNNYKHQTPPFGRFNTMDEGLRYWTLTYGLEKLLRFADRSSMAHAIEVRLPFLDHKLVEYVFSIPSEFKIKNGWTKSLIRYSFNDLLPDEITWRKNKLAFQVPEKKWESNPDWQKFIKPYINICADFNYATNNSYNWSLISLGLWLKSIS